MTRSRGLGLVPWPCLAPSALLVALKDSGWLRERDDKHKVLVKRPASAVARCLNHKQRDGLDTGTPRHDAGPFPRTRYTQMDRGGQGLSDATTLIGNGIEIRWKV